MEDYITKRKTLKRIYVVLDARHGVKVADIDFFKMLDR
jgi:GTP-binding protein EngB required for normal cell division